MLNRLSLSLLAAAILLAVPCSPCFAQYKVEPQLMPLLPPGTIIGKQAAAPWTHIIIKSHPRCTQGDVRDVSRMHISMTSLLTTSLLAEVKRAPNGQFILNRVAGGVSKNIKGQDVIITPETQSKLGAKLGILERVLLKEFVTQQKTITFVGRSANLAVFDTPIVLRNQTTAKNERKVLRYAVLVDSATGSLETLCWPIHKKGSQYAGVAGPMQWLPNNHIIDCQLWVDKSEIRFGIPSKEAFACVSVPPGQVQIRLPDQVAPVLCQQRYTQDSLKQAESLLRRVIPQAQAGLQRQHTESVGPR